MSIGPADFSRNDRAASYSSCLGSPRPSSHRLQLAAKAPTANVAAALKMAPSRFRTPSPVRYAVKPRFRSRFLN